MPPTEITLELMKGQRTYRACPRHGTPGMWAVHMCSVEYTMWAVESEEYNDDGVCHEEKLISVHEAKVDANRAATDN